MMANAGKPWCATQDDQLLSLARDGKSVAEVAQIMGRTQQGIVARADRLSYRLTSTDQYTLLSAFISTARHLRPAVPKIATQQLPEARADQARPDCSPLMLEVHTEQFSLVLQALHAAGFQVKSRPNIPVRYVVSDPVKQGESV